MKRKIPIILFLIIALFSSLFFSGCKTRKMEPNEVTDFLKDMNSYSTDVSIQIKNDKQTINYNCKEFYRQDIGYRLEINQDRVMIYKNNKIYINDIKNNKKYVAKEDFDNLYSYSFIGEYIRLLYTDENVKYSYKTESGREFLLIKLIIPGGSREINNAVMYVDNKSFKPEKVIIFDDKGNEKVLVEYKKLILDEDVSENLFAE